MAVQAPTLVSEGTSSPAKHGRCSAENCALAGGGSNVAAAVIPATRKIRMLVRVPRPMLAYCKASFAAVNDYHARGAAHVTQERKPVVHTGSPYRGRDDRGRPMPDGSRRQRRYH